MSELYVVTLGTKATWSSLLLDNDTLEYKLSPLLLLLPARRTVDAAEEVVFRVLTQYLPLSSLEQTASLKGIRE